MRIGFVVLLMLPNLIWQTPRSAQADDATASLPYQKVKPGLDVGVVVTDMSVAKKFYGGALGLAPLPPLPIALPGGGEMVRFRSGGTTVKLRSFPTTPAKTEHGTFAANGIRLLAFFVGDPDQVVKPFKDNGFEPPTFGPRREAGYRIALLYDPDGNRIELISTGADAKPDALQRFQIGLTVSDIDKAVAFYGTVLGLKPRPPFAMPGHEEMNEYLFDSDVSTIKFWSPKAERPTRTGAIGAAAGIRYFTFLVKDVDATHEALKAKGVKITTPPVNLGSVARIMLAADPDGNTIEFAQPLGPR